jgi:hypothetical protein
MRASRLGVAKWAIASTRWASRDGYDGARRRTLYQWHRDRLFYDRRIEARRRRARMHAPKDRAYDARTLSSELQEEKEFEKAVLTREILPGREAHAILGRQRRWLLNALTLRETVRVLVLRWRRQPGHWAGVRRDLGLRRLTPWALRRTAAPSWLSAAVDEAANSRLERKRKIAFERWKAGLDEQRRSQALPSPDRQPASLQEGLQDGLADGMPAELTDFLTNRISRNGNLGGLKETSGRQTTRCRGAFDSRSRCRKAYRTP